MLPLTVFVWTILSIIWYNFTHQGLGKPEINTLFSKDILFNMYSCISCRMATINERENAVPTDLESNSSDSSFKTPKRKLE